MRYQSRRCIRPAPVLSRSSRLGFTQALSDSAGFPFPCYNFPMPAGTEPAAWRPLEMPELSAGSLRNFCDESCLTFQTTADLPPLRAIIGQDRAVQSLEFGLGIREKGYNIYAAGQAGYRQDHRHHRVPPGTRCLHDATVRLVLRTELPRPKPASRHAASQGQGPRASERHEAPCGRGPAKHIAVPREPRSLQPQGGNPSGVQKRTRESLRKIQRASQTKRLPRADNNRGA